MTDRADAAKAFLDQTTWAEANRSLLAGDASNRRYERLTDQASGDTAVLMDAPPDSGEDVRPFVAIARHLSGLGLSAPGILAEDTAHGFLLLEDLGDDLFARVLMRDSSLEKMLYEAATDALAHLHLAHVPDVPRYDSATMSDLAALAFHKYRAGIVGDVGAEALDLFRSRFEDILSDTISGPDVLVLRDYHAENLIWLPHRDGVARVGLLDFQDAMAGHRAYDLVSLLQDARRDVPAEIESMMIDRYLKLSGLTEHQFRTAYNVLGVQRNLRIIGVFARLATEYGKPHYVNLIPRVWEHMVRGLQHPALKPVADLVLDNLPVPTAENLARLRPE